MQIRSSVLAVLGMLSLVTASDALARGTGQARGQFEPPVARDVNPDPDIVEVYLEARVAYVQFSPGRPSPVWTYNGGIPGPTIEAEVGDRLIVHFTNHLPEDTTIHWHGVEVPANMDGSNISQLAVPPGGTFRYEFDLLTPATYWYHPHIRSHEQVEKGLYGALIVRDPDQDAALGLPGDDIVAVLDDVLLDDNREIAEPFPSDPLANAKTQLDGREGNTLLVNGRVDRKLHVRSGEPVRFRFINAANARFMRVSIPRHTMYRIGGDGGLLEHAIALPPIDQVSDPADPDHTISNPDRDLGLLLAPGERADVLLVPCGHPGERIPVQWHDTARGRHQPFYLPDGTIGITHDPMDGRHPSQTMMTLRIKGGGRTSCPEPDIPPWLRDIEPIDVTNADPIPVTFGHSAPNADGDVTFFATFMKPFDMVTPADAPDVYVGETRVWEVTNLTGTEHPFHDHGFFFYPMEVEYIDTENPANNRVVPYPYLEAKDTIIVPARPGAAGVSRTILRAAVVFDDTGREGQIAASGKTPGATTSGGWVMHCHILEHADLGMMSFIELLP